MLRQTFNQKVIPLFSFSLLVATIGALVSTRVPPILYLPIIILEFVLLFATFLLRRNNAISGFILYIFVFLTGLTTGPFIFTFLQAGATGQIIVIQALALTTIIFLALAGFVYFTAADFRSIGLILGVSLVGLIVASLINIFVHSSLTSLVISIIATIIFMGYVLYDMSKILNDYDDTQVYPAVLALYLDFLNLFINILEILGFINREER